jgi:predicted nucleic acid-binding protein
MPVLDTNFLFALHDGQEAAVDLLRRHRDDPLLVPDVVAAEFLTDWQDAEVREKVLEALVADFTVCTTDLDWIRTAAALRARLRKKRALVRRADVCIAAWAVHRGMPVITQDADDFSRLGVDVVTW